jgi:hypothetical protein
MQCGKTQVLADMAGHQTTLMRRQASPCDGVRTLTITRADTTLIETLTLGNGVTDSTGLPETVAPASKSSNSSSNYVGAILSAVVVVVVLIFIIWVCCRKGNLLGDVCCQDAND